MISDYRCFYCFVRTFEKLLRKENIPKDAKNRFTHEMIDFFQKNWDNLNSPEFARRLHYILREYTHNPDPFIKEKKENNDQALNLVPRLESIINKSADPFKTALRLAIAGNVIDFVANDNFNIFKTIDKVLESEFAIDHSAQLRNALASAESVLYLGDNAGEIVFDRLFIRIINHKNLTYAVRGGPVMNDATMKDAEYTGLTKIVNVISSEYDAPSTVPGMSGNIFKKHFSEADIIISKGQGNLEGLVSLGDNRIFFLLMIKCDVMAEFLNVDKESFVIFNSSIINNMTKL
jgi:uncharacterized protein with ATP-grasp and redox domains